MSVQRLSAGASAKAGCWKAAVVLASAVIVGVVVDDRGIEAAGQKPAAPKPAASSSAESTYKNVYDGWKLWHVYCARCHGENAIGGALAPNLISPNQKQSSAAFLKVVRSGVPDTAMQAWNKQLTNQQIGRIHLYVRARADKVLPAGRPDEVGPNQGKWVPPAGWPPATAPAKR